MSSTELYRDLWDIWAIPVNTLEERLKAATRMWEAYNILIAE